MLKYLPILILLTACGSSDNELPTLNTAKPVLLVEQPAPVPEVTPEQEVQPAVGEVVEQPAPEASPETEIILEVTPEPVVEEVVEPEPEPQMQIIEVPQLVNDIIEPTIITIEQVEVELSEVIGTYDLLEEWRVPASAGRPQPFIKVTMSISWKTNADGVDVVIDEVYSHTQVESTYQLERTYPGQLGVFDPLPALPKIEIRAWIEDAEKLSTVVWL